MNLHSGPSMPVSIRFNHYGYKKGVFSIINQSAQTFIKVGNIGDSGEWAQVDMGPPCRRCLGDSGSTTGKGEAWTDG